MKLLVESPRFSAHLTDDLRLVIRSIDGPHISAVEECERFIVSAADTALSLLDAASRDRFLDANAFVDFIRTRLAPTP